MKAIIFDFDGVIADTMTDNFAAWSKTFNEYGVSISPSDYYVLEGMGRFQIAQFFIEKYQLNSDLKAEIADKKEAYYKKNNTFSVFHWVSEILSLLNSQNIPTGLVTGASRDRLYTFIPAEVKDALSIIVTSDDVVNTKPDPEPYLKAIRMLGKPANECVVVENAPLGIQSAKAAGCICYALSTTLAASYLTAADEVFTDHYELYGKLKQKIL